MQAGIHATHRTPTKHILDPIPHSARNQFALKFPVVMNVLGSKSWSMINERFCKQNLGVENVTKISWKQHWAMGAWSVCESILGL